jgi:hypothetical protein
LVPVANRDRSRAEVPDLVLTGTWGAVSGREKDPGEAKGPDRVTVRVLGLAGRAAGSVPIDVPVQTHLPKQSRNRKFQ